MTSSTNGQPVLVSGERRDPQRSEEDFRKERADREAKAPLGPEYEAAMHRQLFGQFFGEK